MQENGEPRLKPKPPVNRVEKGLKMSGIEAALIAFGISALVFMLSLMFFIRNS